MDRLSGASPAPEGAERPAETPAGKLPFIPPRVQFVQPTLTRHGSLADVTAGFFGIFSP